MLSLQEPRNRLIVTKPSPPFRWWGLGFDRCPIILQVWEQNNWLLSLVNAQRGQQPLNIVTYLLATSIDCIH